jgi:hypothetical protein
VSRKVSRKASGNVSRKVGTKVSRKVGTKVSRKVGTKVSRKVVVVVEGPIGQRVRVRVMRAESHYAPMTLFSVELKT